MQTAKGNVLLVSAGAKISLVRSFKEACEKRGIELVATNAYECMPSERFTHRSIHVPDSQDHTWDENILRICKGENIALLVPTRHSDLSRLSALRSRLDTLGCQILLSHQSCLDIALDKTATWNFLAKANIPLPRQCLHSDASTHAWTNSLPIIAKSPTGAGGNEVQTITHTGQLEAIPGNWILQTIAPGSEFTTNAYVSKEGKILTVIPHRRIACEGGEVIHARTERQKVLIDLARKVLSMLPGVVGPINIQAFLDEERQTVELIEINPRFGGGYPIVHQAGANFAEWALQEYIDGQSPNSKDDWIENLAMTRYKESLFEIQ